MFVMTDVTQTYNTGLVPRFCRQGLFHCFKDSLEFIVIADLFLKAQYHRSEYQLQRLCDRL